MKAIIRTKPDRNGDQTFEIERVCDVQFVVDQSVATGFRSDTPPVRSFPASLICSIQLMEEEE